jgi:hypothetical protein
MRNLAILGIALWLTGCANPNLIEHQLYVPKVQESVFQKCKIIEKYPEVANLRDSKVAQTINELDRNNKNCKAALDAVHAILIKANMIAQ